MGRTKLTVFLAVILLFLAIVWGLFRLGYFVLDRNVFDFQINPIIDSGEIRNINQYRIVHNYIEMKFEENPDEFERDKIIEKLDEMMGTYHENYP